ncbi:ABC transporter ATP-binding protein [Nocardioides salsibiostraticola]
MTGHPTGNPTGNSVSLRGLSRSFGSLKVLDEVDLDVAPGEIMAVLGPSGCGKTTMLRILAGFLDPDAGSVSVDGSVVATHEKQVPPQKRRIGYVPQEGALFPHLTVRGNILFGLPRKDRTEARLAEMLDLANLPPAVADASPHQLSGGQQQRVALARALAPRPGVVLLDEPFSSLDAALRTSTGQDVVRVLRAAGTTAVLVTHDQGEALSLSDRVAVMRGGKIAQVSHPADLYAAPADTDVASFVGGATVLPARITNGRVECGLGSLTVSPAYDVAANEGRDVTIVIRPEQIDLVDDATLPQATVEEVGFFGPYSSVRLRSGSIGLTARDTGGVVRKVGDVLGVAVLGSVSVY